MTEPIYRLLRNDFPLPTRHIYTANLRHTVLAVSVRRKIHSACGISAESLLDAAHSSFLPNYGFACSDDLDHQMCDHISQIMSRFLGC